MKGKSLFLLGSFVGAAMLVGGTFAAWAVTDNADPFSVNITPGSLEVGNDKSVTLNWGTKGLVNIEGLAMGEEKGPYEVGLVATTSDASAFTGSLRVSMATTSVAADKLIDYLHVNVYGAADKTGGAILTVPDGSGNYTVAQDIEVTSGTEKKVYFFIKLDDGMTPLLYNAIKDDVVTLTVDWNKGSAIQEVSSYTYYFNNTASWSNVYAYAWKEADGSLNANWPGVKMDQAKGAIYSTALGALYDKVIFNDGNGNQTADLDLNHLTPYRNGDAWEAAPVLDAEVNYYLVGTHNEWLVSSEAKLTAAAGTDETFAYTYKIENVVVPAHTQLKVVSSENVWYAEASTDGAAANITIDAAGTYNFYFNPNKSEDKYIKCKTVALAEVEYFLVGTHNDWATDDASVKLTAENDTVDGFAYKYKIEDVEIAANGEVKVFGSNDVWYGEQAIGGANMTIGDAGHYDFFFNPDKSGDNYIYCKAHVVLP